MRSDERGRDKRLLRFARNDGANNQVTSNQQQAPRNCDNYHFIISVNRELFGNFENMI